MRRWIERTIAVLLLMAAAAGLWFAYHLYSRPAELKVAVGPAGSDDYVFLTALSRRLADTKAAVRLTLVSRNNPIEAAQAFDRGQADLAVLRGDLPIPGSARAVAILQKSAVLIIATDKNKKTIENFGQLKKRKLGVLGIPGANDRLIDRLSAHYGLAATDITRLPLKREDAVEAIRTGRVDAVLGAGPLSGPTIANVNAAVARAFRGVPSYIEIDAEAIAKSAPEYESEDIPKGTFRSSPANPDDDVTTLFFSHLLVAKSSLKEETVAALTRLLFDARVPLQAEFPSAKLIEAASTDKDAAVPVHPGAAAYYDGSEKTFMERYGDAFFYGPMLLSLIGTAALGAYRYLSRDDSFELADRLRKLRKITSDAARAQSVGEITKLESELGGMFDELIEKLARGGLQESEISTALLVFKHVSDTLAERRHVLADQEPIPAAAAMPPSRVPA
jgi:TRAP transporter TAXI family solute receptor